MDLEDLLEKDMVIHSGNPLLWRIPWTEEPGGLQSMGSQRVTNTFTFKQTVKLEKPHWTTYTVVTKGFGFDFQLTQSDMF